MTSRIIAKDALPGLLAGWSRDAAVFAPVKAAGRDYTEYRLVTGAVQVCLDRVNTKLGAKGQLFPQCETMFRFKPGDEGHAETSEEPGPQIIFGIRPCDAAAIAVLDRFFISEGRADTYYQRRRYKTLLVGLACNTAADTCFCTAVGGSPAATRGLDLLLTDLGATYLAEPITEKGEALVKDLPAATAADETLKQQLADKCAASLPRPFDTAALKRRLDAGAANPVWDELGLPCVNCGACTFFCPTCHCFDITDEQRKGKGARIRVWDSCQFCQYSQHASGHNPRATGESRTRNRTMDKFKYTVDMIGELSCVGCGRCIIECPAAIDVRETIETLMARLPEK